MKIILATDHAGFELKEKVKVFLIEKGYKIEDVGAHTYVADDDYPEYIVKAAMEISKDIDGENKAIIFGGSGQGEAIVANRFLGVRAIVYYGETTNSKTSNTSEIIQKSREHNDANVLSIGARYVNEDEAKKVIIEWLETPFSNEERHIRRIYQIDNIQ